MGVEVRVNVDGLLALEAYSKLTWVLYIRVAYNTHTGIVSDIA